MIRTIIPLCLASLIFSFPLAVRADTPAPPQTAETQNAMPAPQASPNVINPYETLILRNETQNGIAGCLWRMPGLHNDRMQFFSALSYNARADKDAPALLFQLAGATMESLMVRPARLTRLRLYAGDMFDSNEGAPPVIAENGVLRIVLPPEKRDHIAKALTANGGRVAFTLAENGTDQPQDYDFILPAPTATDLAAWQDCLKQAGP